MTLGFILAGCSDVPNVENDKSGIVYNGNAGVVISDNLFYGNAYTDISSYSSLSEINSAKNVSYLSRIDLSKRDAKGNNFTPKGNLTLANEVVATDYQFMFALGNYVYFLKPDERVYDNSGSASQQFTYPTLSSIKLDGGKVNGFYNFENEISQIEALVFDGKNYVVALAGNKLVAVELNGNGGGKATTLAENVQNVAIPETAREMTGERTEWNGKIYYVATDDDGKSSINEVSVNDANKKQTIYGKNGGTVSFLYREGDIIVYSYQDQYSNTFVYYNDVSVYSSRDEVIDIDRNKLISTSATDIDIISGVNTTFVFNGGSGMQYVNTKGGRGILTINDSTGTAISDYTIMFVNDKLAYIATATNIYEVDLTPITQKSADQTLSARRMLATMTSIKTSGELYSYDSGYIYFYAQLEELSDEEQEKIQKEKEEAGIEVVEDEETVITDLDAGHYLYRLNINNGVYELIGTTSYEERHSDYVY